MRRLAATAVLSAALLALSGCKGPCRELSEKLCDCAISSVAREQCVRLAANSEARVTPSTADEEFCEQKLETCDCRQIETDEGKAACGLSR
jgi:hypothetical protein